MRANRLARPTVFAVLWLTCWPAHAQSLNPAVTPETIDSTICVKGWTASVRPPYYETQVIKRDLLKARGETWDQAPLYELDHIVPLVLGGHPSDRANFMLQPWPEARRKDRLEVQASRCVCANVVPLSEAQDDLAKDWQAAYHKYAKLKCGRP